MAHDMSDPHFAVGFEHGYCDEKPYRWQYAHHQERYEAGYHAGYQKRRADIAAAANDPSLSNFEKFARQMQSQKLGYAYQQAPGPGWPRRTP